jgi:hypothetical protein
VFARSVGRNGIAERSFVNNSFIFSSGFTDEKSMIADFGLHGQEHQRLTKTDRSGFRVFGVCTRAEGAGWQIGPKVSTNVPKWLFLFAFDKMSRIFAEAWQE